MFHKTLKDGLALAGEGGGEDGVGGGRVGEGVLVGMGGDGDGEVARVDGPEAGLRGADADRGRVLVGGTFTLAEGRCG